MTNHCLLLDGYCHPSFQLDDNIQPEHTGSFRSEASTFPSELILMSMYQETLRSAQGDSAPCHSCILVIEVLLCLEATPKSISLLSF